MGGAGCRCESCPAADLAASRTTHHHRHCPSPQTTHNTTVQLLGPGECGDDGLGAGAPGLPLTARQALHSHLLQVGAGTGGEGSEAACAAGVRLPPPLSHLLSCPPPTRCRCCCRAAHPHPSGAPFTLPAGTARRRLCTQTGSRCGCRSRPPPPTAAAAVAVVAAAHPGHSRCCCWMSWQTRARWEVSGCISWCVPGVWLCAMVLTGVTRAWQGGRAAGGGRAGHACCGGRSIHPCPSTHRMTALQRRWR